MFSLIRLDVIQDSIGKAQFSYNKINTSSKLVNKTLT